MAIQVRYFAALREHMGCSGVALATDRLLTVAEVWEATAQGRSIPDRTLCAVNMEYARFDTPVSDGDEVAFFPPVTGG